jgi:hypothetical protein
MANQKISDLSLASSLSGTEVVPVVQSGTTKKVTVQTIANLAGVIAGPTGPVGATGAQGPTGPAGSGGGGEVIETTYSDLYDLYTNQNLVVGTYYKITDFQTCYDQPDYDYNGNSIINGGTGGTGNYRAGNLSPIIVFAIDSSSLASDAYQPQWPNDSIKYDITFNSTEATSNPAFGRITYRKDNQGNAFDYDFREVLFKRYDTYISENVYAGTVSIEFSNLGANFADVTGVGTTFTNFTTGQIVGILNLNNNPIVTYYEIVSIEDDTNMVVTGNVITTLNNTRLLDANLLEGVSWKQNNIISNTASVELPTFGDIGQCFGNVSTNTTAYTIWDEYDFLLPNNVFKGSRTYLDNSFGHDFRNNTFNASCDSNRVIGRFENNIIDNDFDNNTINDNFYDNIMDCDFQRNTITGEFAGNHLGDQDGNDFDYNIIQSTFFGNFYAGEDDFEYNIIKGGFSGNIILGEFSKNTLNGFSNNVLEATFSDNQVGESFYNNKTYQEFRENVIGDEVYDNNFFSVFIGNTLNGDEHYNNNFYSQCLRNRIGAAFSLNNIGDSTNIGNTYFTDNVIGNNFYSNDTLGNAQYNVIGNDFNNNTVGSNFSYNQIGNLFSNNTIAEDFGFGGGQCRGNRIGNAFTANTVGEYFYDNILPDNCQNNTIGDYFQWNVFNTSVIGIDFTANYGNITEFTYIALGNATPDGTYVNRVGTSNGQGVDASFDIEVSGFAVTGVTGNASGKLYGIGDTITIPGTQLSGSSGLINSFTSNGFGLTGADGSYTDILAQGGTGTGENSTFDVTVASGIVNSVSLTYGGEGYSLGNVLTIPGSAFGGTEDINITVDGVYSDDVIITVTGIGPNPSVYETYTCQIFERQGGSKRLSYYYSNDILTITNINE